MFNITRKVVLLKCPDAGAVTSVELGKGRTHDGEEEKSLKL